MGSFSDPKKTCENDSWFIAHQMFLHASRDSIASAMDVMLRAREAFWVDFRYYFWLYELVVETAVRVSVVDHAPQIKELLGLACKLAANTDPQRRGYCIYALRKVTAALVIAKNAASCRTLKGLAAISLHMHEEKWGMEDIQTGVALAHLTDIAACAMERHFNNAETKEYRKLHALVSTFGSVHTVRLKEILSSDEFLTCLGTITHALASHGDTTIAARTMHHSIGYAEKKRVEAVDRSATFLRSRARAVITAIVFRVYHPRQVQPLGREARRGAASHWYRVRGVSRFLRPS